MIDVIISAKKILTNYTEDEIFKIKQDLTLPNPAYDAALRYSPYSKVALPKTLSYYEYTDDGIAVPRGYEIPFPHQTISDDRFENHVIFPKIKVTPRQMQMEAMDSFAGNTDAMLISPTASGKSVMILLLLAKIKNKALVIVHKDDLISGWTDDIKKCFSLRYGQIGLIKAQSYVIGKQITLTTVQTLSKLSKEKIEELKKEFGVIVCDEMHHSPSNTWGIISQFPAKYRIGVTATAMRNDGLGEVMFFYFGKPCFTYKESEENKDIIPPSKVFIKRKIAGTMFNPKDIFVNSLTQRYIDINAEIKKGTNIDEKIKSGEMRRKPMDYNLARKSIQEDAYFNAQVCKDVKQEFDKGKSCLIFCFEKEHCRTLFTQLERIGIPRERIQLYYGDAIESKEEMKRKAESREVLITIATYSIGTEGTNVKAWERMFLAMTIGNPKDTIQAVGRGRRTSPGKSDLIVYDYVFPNVKGIRNHWKIRESVYREIGFRIS